MATCAPDERAGSAMTPKEMWRQTPPGRWRTAVRPPHTHKHRGEEVRRDEPPPPPRIHQVPQLAHEQAATHKHAPGSCRCCPSGWTRSSGGPGGWSRPGCPSPKDRIRGSVSTRASCSRPCRTFSPRWRSRVFLPSGFVSLRVLISFLAVVSSVLSSICIILIQRVTRYSSFGAFSLYRLP